MEAAFGLPTMAMLQNSENQITSFLCCCANGSSGLLCIYPNISYLQHIPKKKLFPAFDFQPRCLLPGGALHAINNFIISDDVHTNRNFQTVKSPARDATSSVGEA